MSTFWQGKSEIERLNMLMALRKKLRYGYGSQQLNLLWRRGKNLGRGDMGFSLLVWLTWSHISACLSCSQSCWWPIILPGLPIRKNTFRQNSIANLFDGSATFTLSHGSELDLTRIFFIFLMFFFLHKFFYETFILSSTVMLHASVAD
jgi:hypothetical protein